MRSRLVRRRAALALSVVPAIVLACGPSIAGASEHVVVASAGRIDDVACPPRQCVGVGYQQVQGYPEGTPETWALQQGKWTSATVSAGAAQHRLQGISSPQAGECIAVGVRIVGSSTSGFAEQLRAGSWASMALPSGAPSLSSVSCVSDTWCMAVGGTGTGMGTVDLWNGSDWTESAAATAPTPDGLDAVSCLDIDHCMAVGFSESTPLAESWNGSAWTVTTQSATYYQASSDLASVSCPSVSFCAAVGSANGCCGSLSAFR
jgi:hypothetical protein